MSITYDRGPLRAPRELADGSLVVDAVIARTGLQSYENPPRVEYRSAEEVFSADAMASFELMAVTDQHPSTSRYPMGVTIDNRSQLGKGTVVPGSLRRDGDLLVASLHITDANLIAAMRAGRRQVSCGYFQTNIAEPGVTSDGKPYQRRQTEIRGNHVAIVDYARAGDIAEARMDSMHGDSMFKTVEEATAAYQAEKMRADSADRERIAATAARDTAQAAADAAKTKAETAEKLRLDGEASALVNARKRVQLEQIAAKLLTVDGKPAPTFDGQTDQAIRVAVIERLTGKALPADKASNPVYVEARYDSELDGIAGEVSAAATVRAALRPSAQPTLDADQDLEAARRAMIERNQNAYKPTKGA